jgi:hypothetical protein
MSDEDFRMKLYLMHLDPNEQMDFEFTAGRDNPPTLVIRSAETETDEEGPYVPLRIFSCMDDVTDAATLADTLEELAAMLRQAPDEVEGEDH